VFERQRRRVLGVIENDEVAVVVILALAVHEQVELLKYSGKKIDAF
jgi:hypothetical protein